jgi:hypothetical protein
MLPLTITVGTARLELPLTFIPPSDRMPQVLLLTEVLPLNVRST